MSLLDRLKIYMEHLQFTVSQFADAAAIPRPTLSQILSGRNKKISNEVLEKLHKAYPDLNISWLLFGDGQMCLSESGIPKPMTIDAAPPTSPIQNEEPIQTKASTHNEFAPVEIETQVPIPIKADSGKRVTLITVFYSDKSFENFYPQKS